MAHPQSKSALLVSAAILLRQAGYDQKAIEILKVATREDPGFAPAFVLLGALFQAVEDTAQAEAHYRQALMLDPKNAEALQGLGLFLVSRKRYSEALPHLENHLKQNPADSLSLDGLIESLHHLPGREKQIKTALQTAWEVSRDPDLGIRFGRYLLEQSEPQEARNVFSAVVEVSKTPRALAELALTCYITEDCDCAIQWLLEAVEIDPLFDRGWRGLAQCYNREKEFDKALEAAERAISINPNHYRNWQAKSDVLLSLRQFEEVLRTSQKGIELIQSLEDKEEAKPVWSVLHLQRFYAFLGLQCQADALMEMEFARKNLPDDLRFYTIPVQIFLGNDQPEQALAIVELASNPIMVGELAPIRYKILHQLGRGEEAWNFIHPYLDKNTKKRINNLANIGLEFYLQGDVEPAITVYRQLLRFTPEDARIATTLGYILIGERRFNEAEQLLSEVVNTPHAQEHSEIARCNLSYLYNLSGFYQKALDTTMAVLRSDFADDDVILRVPFWVKGKMLPDPAPIPGREISLADAARACGASAWLALNEADQAEQSIQALGEREPLLQSLLLGSLEQSRGHSSQAIQHWKSALDLIESDAEREMIEHWIQTVE